MPGFSLYFNIPATVKTQSGLVCGQMIVNGAILHRFTINKFLNDKLFAEDDHGVLIIDGVILNQQNLLKTYGKSSWKDCVWNMYIEKGERFFAEFRGSFAGALYDRKNDRWIVSTDHFSSKQVFYYQKGSSIIFSTDISEIYRCLSEAKIEVKLDVNAAFMLLSYGYMVNDSTLCEDVKKIQPGCYAVLKNGRITAVQYHRLPQSSISDTYDEREIIENIDAKFRNAVTLQFDKDRHYGYEHFVSLSGGLDSRMVTWVAHYLGYTSQINFTFSQSDYLDEKTPKKIAATLRHEWIFKALDNGLFLRDLDKINELTGGNVLYYGLAHSNSMYRMINFSPLGIIHSGQIGDAVIGSILKDVAPSTLKKQGGAYSEKLLSKVTGVNFQYSSFPEKEIALLYQRAFNGANNGNLSEQQYSEIVSPFCDVEFAEYCLSIPLNARLHHNIYKKWIMKKYPAAAGFVWESTRRKISDRTFHVRIGNRRIPVDQLHNAALRRLRLRKKPSFTPANMNPLDYWYRTNPDIRHFQDKYVDDNIQRLCNHKELQDSCRTLYENETSVEKNQVLTLLSAIKMFSLT